MHKDMCNSIYCIIVYFVCRRELKEVDCVMEQFVAIEKNEFDTCELY